MSALTFAEKLLAWRTEKRWTRAAALECLSARLGVPLPLRTLEDWESGRRVPHPLTQRALEEAISCS